MINLFEASLEKNDSYKDRKNIYGSDVLEMFTAIPWNEDRKECFKTEDEFGSFFTVSYKNADNLKFSFDAELYIDDEHKDENFPIKFSLTYSYQHKKTKKILFGLLGEKEETADENIFMDDQNMEFTLKCLNAFLRHDHEFLISNMYENFGTDLKE
jgi:hypothetical protein